MQRKGRHNHPVSILLIILLGMAVLVYHTGQSYVQLSGHSVEKISHNSDKDDANSSQQEFKVSNDVILSVSSIHLDQELYQIKEIVFGDEEGEELVPHIVERLTPYFRILFRQVISPNAP